MKQKACSILCSDYHYPSLLQSVYMLLRNGSAGFAEAVALVSGNVAKAAELSDRGGLAQGQRADFLLVEPGEQARLIMTVAAGQITYLAPGALSRLS